MRRALTYEDSVRWGRCMAETVKIASTVCPASAMEAYGEIVNRLHVRSAFRPSSSLAEWHDNMHCVVLILWQLYIDASPSPCK